MITLNPNDKLTTNFKVKDLYFSNTAKARGIDNTPNAQQLMILLNCVNSLLQPLRTNLKVPLGINSAFRGSKLNKSVGGASSSDHCVNMVKRSCAFDIDDTFSVSKGISNREIAKELIHNSDYNFYKLIYEFPSKVGGVAKWVHLSFSQRSDLKNQRNVYIAWKQNGKTKYIPVRTQQDLEKWGLAK